MSFTITFRHMEPTDAIKNYAAKVERLQKFLHHPMETQVVLSAQDHRLYHVEVHVHAGGEHLHAHDLGDDLYASLDKVVDKLEREILASKRPA